MSTIANDLILHLPFDEVTNGSISDASSNNHDGATHGDIDLTPDDVFGAALAPDGVDDYVTVEHHADLEFGREENFGIMAWLRAHEVQPETDTTQLGIIEKWGGGGSHPYAYSLRYNHVTGKIHASRSDGTLTSALVSVRSINDGVFHHVALIKRGYDLELYIDGVIDTQAVDATDPGVGGSQMFIGARVGDVHHLAGLLCNVRVYKTAPTASELLEVMEADRMSGEVYRSEHPLAFNLIDGAALQTLFIGINPDGRTMNLNIRNTSAQDIVMLRPTIYENLTDHYNLELRFRPATLTPESQIKIKPNSGEWDYAHITHASGEVSLYMRRWSDLTIPAGATHTELIDFVGAEPHGGPRNTRMQFRYGRLRYVGNTAPLGGVRSAHLNIVNQIRKKDIPLHVTLDSNATVGDDFVLNDGASANALLLRITNTDKDDAISFLHKDREHPTRFIVSFDVPDVHTAPEDALTTASDAANISVEPVYIVSQGSEHNVSLIESAMVVGGGSPKFTCTFTADTGFLPGEYFILKIANVISALPNSVAKIYINYENIPGYWDGQLVVTTRKQPLTILENRVGIGKLDPAWWHGVQIAGAVRATKFISRDAVPSGAIVRWFDTDPTPPEHWVFCDGNNGTPNLNTPSETYILKL